MFGELAAKRFKKISCEGWDFLHVMKKLVHRCDIEECELMAVVARKIWFRRNPMAHWEVGILLININQSKWNKSLLMNFKKLL
jgi:hypothetical protein